MAVGAQVSIRTTGDFETSCITKNGYKLKASGMYRDKSIDVQLQLSLENKDVISIVTSIDAPLGHPVVLGMSPMQVGNSAFVIVVE